MCCWAEDDASGPPPPDLPPPPPRVAPTVHLLHRIHFPPPLHVVYRARQRHPRVVHGVVHFRHLPPPENAVCEIPETRRAALPLLDDRVRVQHGRVDDASVVHPQRGQVVVDRVSHDHRLVRAESVHERLGVLEGEFDPPEARRRYAVDPRAVIGDRPPRPHEGVEEDGAVGGVGVHDAQAAQGLGVDPAGRGVAGFAHLAIDGDRGGARRAPRPIVRARRYPGFRPAVAPPPIGVAVEGGVRGVPARRDHGVPPPEVGRRGRGQGGGRRTLGSRRRRCRRRPCRRRGGGDRRRLRRRRRDGGRGEGCDGETEVAKADDGGGSVRRLPLLLLLLLFGLLRRGARRRRILRGRNRRRPPEVEDVLTGCEDDRRRRRRRRVDALLALVLLLLGGLDGGGGGDGGGRRWRGRDRREERVGEAGRGGVPPRHRGAGAVRDGYRGGGGDDPPRERGVGAGATFVDLAVARDAPVGFRTHDARARDARGGGGRHVARRRLRGGAADEGGGGVPVREFAVRAAAAALVGGVEGAQLGTGAVGRGGGQLVSLALGHVVVCDRRMLRFYEFVSYIIFGGTDDYRFQTK